MALAEKIQLLRRLINIEPLVILYVFIQQNHFQLALNYTSSLYGLRIFYFINSIPVIVIGCMLIPITLALFWGSYSDKYKCRKPFLFLPLYGDLISIMTLFFCARNEDACSEYTLRFALLIPFIFGRGILFSMAAIAYLADISDGQTRTLRMGLMEVVILVPQFAFFIDRDVELWTKINCSLAAFSILYVVFWLQEPQQPKIPSKQSILDIINPIHVKETVSIVTVKRAHRGRDIIMVFLWIIAIYQFYLLATVLLIAAMSGLFRFIAGENVGKIGVSLMALTTVTILLIIFVKRMRLDDMIILSFSIVCLGIAHIVFGASRSYILKYISLIIGTGGTFVPGVGKSLLTKMVSKEDHGKMSACIAVCVTLAVSVDVFINFNQVAAAGMDVFSYSASILYFSFLPAVLWLYIVNRRGRREEWPDNNAVVDNEDPL